MDSAVNKVTDERVFAINILDNSSYQNLKENIWTAPKECITNWEELKEKGITEIPVHFVKDKEYINWLGTHVFCSECFAVYPDSPAKTIYESPLHKAIKNWLITYIKKKNDLKVWFSYEGKKKENIKNYIELKQIFDKQGLDSYNAIEERDVSGYRHVRMDILLKFKQKDDLFGWGICFEVQLSNQSDNTKKERAISRVFNGYSVVWIDKDSFETSPTKDDFALKTNELRIYPYASMVFDGLEDKRKELILTVIEQSRLLDRKERDIISSIDYRIATILREPRCNKCGNIMKLIHPENKKPYWACSKYNKGCSGGFKPFLTWWDIV